MKTITKILGIVMILGLVFGFMPASNVSADPPPTDVVYNAIPATLGPSYYSHAFAATSTSEFGDYIHLAGTDRALRTATVTMITWEYKSLWPLVGDGTGWDHPITLNIYNVVPGTPNTLGSLITTKTQTFHIPWRAEPDSFCGGTLWHAPDGSCNNGYAFNITFDLSSLNVILPDAIIVGVAFNTQNWGYHPIGIPGPYNRLNIALAEISTDYPTTFIGTDDNFDRVFLNSMWGDAYKGADKTTGFFREDTGWNFGGYPYGTIMIQITAETQTVVPVYVLDPSWDAVGGGGVYSAYYGPLYYDPVSPGSTALFDGREAGIIKAGILPDTDNHYYDEGLLGFQVANMGIAEFATQALMFDVQNASGLNPVWVRIRLVGGTTYQFVPTTNPAGWHTVDAAAGMWQLMDSNGNATGPLMSLSTLAASIPSAQVDRVYLTLGMGDSYNVSPGVGTVGWVDKVTIGSTTYDFLVAPTCTTDCYVSTTGSDSNAGNAGSPFLTIQKGINTVSVGGTVHVAAGIYSDTLGGWRDIEINKSLSLVGAGSAATIVELSGVQNGIVVSPDTIGVVSIEGMTIGTATHHAAWGNIVFGYTPGTFNQITLKDLDVGYAGARVLIFTGASSVFNNVVIENSNFHDGDIYGVTFQGTTNGLTVTNSKFNHNGWNDPYEGGKWHGYGLVFEGVSASNITVTNSEFNDNGTTGLNLSGISHAVFDGIKANHNGYFTTGVTDGDVGVNFWEFTSGSHDVVFKNSEFSNNERAGIVFGNEAGAVMTNVEVTSSQINNNGRHSLILWYYSPYSGINIHHNRIIDTGTAQALIGQLSGPQSLADNWWGCNAGFDQPGCSSGQWTASGSFTFPSWLVMKVTDLPATIAPHGTAAFDADLTDNNLGADTSGAGFLPATTLVGFTPTARVEPDSDLLTSSVASTVFTAPYMAGVSTTVCAVLDNATVCDSTAVTSASAVYVDKDWVGTALGASVTPVYPAGAPAATFGFNAFANLQDALMAVSAGSVSAPSMVYVDAGTYSGTGTILIDKNWVTVLMNTGVVIQNASPCFTVAADYVTIQAATLAGAKCIPTGDADGIIVTGARKNLTLEKFEIDGAGGDDGVYFDNVITDLVMVDLLIHNLTANGVLFAAQPAGILDIHGNMFRDNAGNGIQAGAFTVPAEYNSWGDYDGAAVSTGGDGISSGVDANPWTHVDMHLVSSGTPIANTVVTGNTITYGVFANLQNVTSMDFTLNYPSNLTFVSYATPGNFSSETITQTAGSVHFVAYKFGAGITTGNFLFEATFTAGTPGTNLPMDLNAPIDGFGMATAGSSTNIYAYALTDSTVTIKDALDLSALSLIEMVPPGPWTPVFGTLPAGYIMGIDPANAYEYLDVASLTVNHPLADGLYPFYLQAGQPPAFFTYWALQGVTASAVPGTWQDTMWDIISGTQPMFYLRVTGTSYDLIDGLQHLIGAGDNPLRISGDYPLGLYNFSGTVTDIYGGTDTVPVAITIISPLVLQSLDLLDSLDKVTWKDVYGSLALGFTKVIDPLNTFEYLDAANLVANRTLADGLYPYYLDTTSLPAGFMAYWAAKGVVSGATGWQGVMWDIINGTEPMFYLKVSSSGTVFKLIDGLTYLTGGGEQPLRISGDYPLGTYHFKGTVADGYGVVDNVSVALTLIAPLDLSDLDLFESIDKLAWTEVFGNLPSGFIMAIDPANPYEYLDANNLVVNRLLADGYYPFTLNTSSLPTDFYAYWSAQGVNAGAVPGTWQAVMWQIINGNAPIFYLRVSGSGTDFALIDGLQYQTGGGDQPLRISGDYPLGTYSFSGTVADLFGYTDSVSVSITFVGTYVVKGTFSMQGRAFRGGIPVTLTKVGAPPFGPYFGTTFNAIFENLVITGVQGGTYMITTLQPRYLNVIVANNKTALISSNRTLNPLELKGGNAIWTNNKVDVQDASLVGTQYGSIGTTFDGDVNFDGRVNIQDLALVGGNFDLTSEVAYGIGNIAPWVP